jgi:hypothetical protein
VRLCEIADHIAVHFVAGTSTKRQQYNGWRVTCSIPLPLYVVSMVSNGWVGCSYYGDAPDQINVMPETRAASSQSVFENKVTTVPIAQSYFCSRIHYVPN